MDLRDAAGAEAWLRDYEAYDDVRRLSNLFVLGGFEIDRIGATNLLGSYTGRNWLRRGPGAIGTTSMSVLAERTVVYTTRHDRGVFVERCSIASTPGWRGARDGPVRCLSPAGVFDFPAPRRQMRLLHVRPGWTVGEVQAATGFPLAGLGKASELPPPADAELEALRALVDPAGTLA
jgi:acyl CoA:acetate/3-ketoacid CoA transferase beta subunit